MAAYLIRSLALLCILWLTWGKNVAPKARQMHSVGGNVSPDLKVTVGYGRTETSQHAPRSSKPEVHPEHVFYNNYKANFSWSDPALLASLGVRLASRDEHIVKRNPGISADNPAIKVPSCLGCIEAARGNVVSLDDLTVTYLRQQILPQGQELINRCVFYTSVPDPKRGFSSIADSVEWAERVALGGYSAEHHGLSKIATDWACQNDKITIWNMYHGQNSVTGGNDTPDKRNFWEVYTTGSWLNFLVNDDADQFKYFERMSTAMAEVCGGRVYVMSMRPKNTQKYKFIWGNHEYPTLLARHNGILGDRPTDLISIDAADKTKQYYLDFQTQAVIGPVKRSDPNYLDFDEAVQKRDTCSSNVNYEPVDEDWFG